MPPICSSQIDLSPVRILYRYKKLLPLVIQFHKTVDVCVLTRIPKTTVQCGGQMYSDFLGKQLH